MSLNAHTKKAALGRTALIATTLIWGTSFVILKNTLDSFSAIYLLALRFTISALIMAVAGFKQLKNIDRKTLTAGAALGVFIFLAYVLQTYGLVYTTPGKNAFLTATYCIITPFLARLIDKTRLSAFNILAAFICIAGIGLVSLRGDFTIGIGDLLTVFCGLFYALHLIFTGRVAGKSSILMLTMIQFIVAGALSWIAALIAEPVPSSISASAIWSILYLSIFCTCICFGLQTLGQKYTSSSAASIILTLESVFGAAISAVFYHEILTMQLLLGFLLIFAAIIISETKLSFLKRKKQRVV